ncbi:hypothetical protein ACHQM5_003516 [Ranunculus cassubicifolius]
MSIQRMLALSKKFNVVDENMSCDPAYLGKAKREQRNRYDYDDFDPTQDFFMGEEQLGLYVLNGREHSRQLEGKGFFITHIYREGNTVADKLANMACSVLDMVWWFQFPSFVASSIALDYIDG